MARQMKVPQGILRPLSKLQNGCSFLTDSVLTRAQYALLITALRFSLRAVSIWLASNRNGSALEMRVINHFEVTGIYHIERTVLAPASARFCLYHSASCSLSFTNANDNLQRAELIFSQVQIAFEMRIIIISSMTVIEHIEMRVPGCNIRLWKEVSTWLHLRLWKDHHLKLTVRILL